MSDTLFPPNAVLSASTDQVSTNLNGEVVILGLTDTVYYGLEEVGTRVWQLLQTPTTLAALVDRVVAEYDVARDEAAADVAGLVADLRARNLVTIELPA
jgi:hypothetical protein